MIMQNKRRLIKALEQIGKRYCSIFFSKLVLHNQYTEEESGYIRHYDIECEAATNIVDILHTKVKAIQLKCFYQIKSFAEDKQKAPKNLNHSYVKSHAGKPNMSFSRTSRNAISSVNIRQFPNDYTTRNMHLRPIVNRRQDIRSQFSDINYSMQALMSKVRTLNEKFGRHTQVDDPQTEYQLPISKVHKRKLILTKLNKLENDISNFLEEENAERYETHSNISRGQKIIPSYLTNSKSGKMHSNTSYFSRVETYERKW